MDITTVGLDLAKNVFQVHGVNAAGDVIVRRRLRRARVCGFFAGLAPCLVGMEACGTAHFWARELVALGHEVKIIPPSYVKAYVRRGKNDAADAAAICEAVARPHMRFVPVPGEFLLCPQIVSVRALHVGQGSTDVGDQFQGRSSSRRFTGWPSVMRLRTSLR